MNRYSMIALLVGAFAMPVDTASARDWDDVIEDAIDDYEDAVDDYNDDLEDYYEDRARGRWARHPGAFPQYVAPVNYGYRSQYHRPYYTPVYNSWQPVYSTPYYHGHSGFYGNSPYRNFYGRRGMSINAGPVQLFIGR